MKNTKLATRKTSQRLLSSQTVEMTLQLYERAIAATSTSIVIADALLPDFPIIYCNAAFVQLTGYSLGEILGQSCLFLQGRDTDLSTLAQIQQALQAKRECRVVLKNYRKDGGAFWNELTISPVRDVSDRITHFICVQVDVTEQQKDKKRMQAQSAAMNASADGMAIFDSTGEFIYINEAYAQMNGYDTTEDLIGKSWKILYDRAELRIFEQYILPALKKSGRWRGEAVGLRQDGSKYRQELSLSEIEAGMGIVCVVRDISDRKQAEVALQQVNESLERRIALDRTQLRQVIDKLHRETLERQQAQAILHESEALLRPVVRNLPIILFATDKEGSIALLEGKGLEPLNLKPGELIGRSILNLYLQEPDILSRINHVIAGGETAWVSEIGNLIYESRATPLKNQSGEILGCIGMAMDITYHVKLEEALRQQADRELLLGAIAQRIRKSLNLEEVLNTTVQEVRQFLQTDRVVLYRFESDWSGVVVVESVGENCEPILGIPIEDPCFKEKYVRQYQQGRIRAIADIHTSDIAQCHIDLLARFEVQANLVVPILQGENLWGLLIAHHCSGPREWQETEVTLLAQLSVQIAISIQQSELYQKLQTELVERLQAEAALRQREELLCQKACELEQTLNELQKTQFQLIQSEKMSSLGQLVAGVAHEINNPVNFIYGNIEPARNYIQDLLDIIDLYEQHCRQPSAEIEEKAEEIDLEFIKQDLPKLLESMRVGSDRIREIVRSLRYFSRTDEAEVKAVNIHEGIDSTLMILQNRLKPNANYSGISIVQEYGKLPNVVCYAGQINQVFMNILSNAIDALQESSRYSVADSQENSHPTPTIRIRTEVLDNNRIAIRIADNGPGMPEAVRQRLFDPFFTTKPVGKGTGLGLSISYQIVVERHGGELHCFSQLGKGTEFAIEIPLHQTRR
ncbi:PAS domain S-box protein [Aerosakkonema funiforme]|uniref:PAS domain S-box protein n=1 Tax=Aerosakkonema funiforme TaxID=1246630 RepID=UPI0035B85704